MEINRHQLGSGLQYYLKCHLHAVRGRTTVSKSSKLPDRHGRYMKRHNTILSPIYENVAYLDLEHRFSDSETDHFQQSEGLDHNVPFQAYMDKRKNKRPVARRRHSDHFPKQTRLGVQPGSRLRKNNEDTTNNKSFETIESTYHDAERKSLDTRTIRNNSRTEHIERSHGPSNIAVPEIIQLTEINPSNQVADESLKEQETDTQLDIVGGKAPFNKSTLKHTASDPTNDRTRTNANKKDYVGYNVIEKFLRENNFETESDSVKSKSLRSNSEPLVNVQNQMQKPFFIDAFDDKSKSLEDINKHNIDDVPVKVINKETKDSKRLSLEFQPIEAYREDGGEVGKTKPNTVSFVQQDDQVPSTSKGLTHSSIYQGHSLDPALLMEPSTPIGSQTKPFEFVRNSRRVKLEPVEHRRRRPCCPAEKKLEKRCFLLFFILLVLTVSVFVLFNIQGWFDGSFIDLYRSRNRKPGTRNLPNMTRVNSTGT